MPLALSFSSVALVLDFGALVAAWLEAQVRARRERRLAAQAGSLQSSHEAPLAPGMAVVMGTVEMAEGEAVAARVEIDQNGSETESSGTYSFKWTEIGRRVRMRPFYLAHASGARVRVEPGGRAMLVDAMDGMILVTAKARTRYAELSPGERVYAVGELARGDDPELVRAGYRSGREGWVLRAPPERALLLSSEPLEQRFRRRAAAASRFGWLTVLATAAALLVSSTYLARLTMGRWTTAMVLDWQCETDSDGTSCQATVRVDDGAVIQISGTDAVGKAAVPGQAAPVCYVAAWPLASTIGAGSNVYSAFVVVLLEVLLLAWQRRRSLRAAAGWYEASLVDEGSGKLAENTRAVSQS